MATTDLTFEQQKNKEYKATYISTGSTVLQMEREAPGRIAVQASIEGMDPIDIVHKPFSQQQKDIIMNIDVPSGISVDIVSGTKVLSAKVLTE